MLDLAYTTASPGSATAVVRVPRSDAPRAQHKLRRLVDVIDVSLDPASVGTAEVPAFSHPPSRHWGSSPVNGSADALSDVVDCRTDGVTLSLDPGPSAVRSGHRVGSVAPPAAGGSLRPLRDPNAPELDEDDDGGQE